MKVGMYSGNNHQKQIYWDLRFVEHFFINGKSTTWGIYREHVCFLCFP